MALDRPELKKAQIKNQLKQTVVQQYYIVILAKRYDRINRNDRNYGRTSHSFTPRQRTGSSSIVCQNISNQGQYSILYHPTDAPYMTLLFVSQYQISIKMIN